MGGFRLQLGGFSLQYLEFLVFIVYKKDFTYLTASFHRFWLLPKAMQWLLYYYLDLPSSTLAPISQQSSLEQTTAYYCEYDVGKYWPLWLPKKLDDHFSTASIITKFDIGQQWALQDFSTLLVTIPSLILLFLAGKNGILTLCLGFCNYEVRPKGFLMPAPQQSGWTLHCTSLWFMGGKYQKNKHASI